jgi:riboflavin synthase
MFTGIVEECGRMASLHLNGHSGSLTVAASKVTQDCAIGDSIAVNGICLTVTGFTSDSFTADVMAETIRRSSLAGARPGDPVNLERAMAAGGRFGGHLVTGHIDGTGTVRDIRAEENAVWYTIEAPAALLRYVVEKGSIAIDGISLTVAGVDAQAFSVSVIPHTRAVTALARRTVGATVNLECDIIAKYVEKLMTPAPPAREASGITEEFLAQYGF